MPLRYDQVGGVVTEVCSICGAVNGEDFNRFGMHVRTEHDFEDLMGDDYDPDAQYAQYDGEADGDASWITEGQPTCGFLGCGVYVSDPDERCDHHAEEIIGDPMQEFVEDHVSDAAD